MTSDEIRGKIRYYEQLIAGYIEEKVQREKELEELDLLKAKVSDLQSRFGDHQAQRQRNLSMLAAMPQRNRIYPAYCSGMQELLEGKLFARTYEGLTDARQKVTGKQSDITGLLEDCERRIQSAKSSAEYWKARLQEALAVEMKQAEEANV